MWCPASAGRAATLVCTAVAAGTVERIDLETGDVSRVADVGGGANAALLASDGGFLVTQNGGIDFTRTGLYADPPPYRPVTPGSSASPRTARSRTSPTASSDDGPYPRAERPRRRGGRHALVHGSAAAPSPAGAARPRPHDEAGRHDERGGPRLPLLQRHRARGGRHARRDRGSRARSGSRPTARASWVTEQISPTGNAGDGLCVDVDGRFYVATTADHGIRVLDPDGTEVDFLAIPGRGITTNCCFGGDDLRTLFATDGIPGQVLAWEGMPTAGAAAAPVAGPARGGVASSSQRSSTPGATHARRHLHRERRPAQRRGRHAHRSRPARRRRARSRRAASATPTSRSSTARSRCRRPRSSGTRAPASSNGSAPRSGTWRRATASSARSSRRAARAGSARTTSRTSARTPTP